MTARVLTNEELRASLERQIPLGQIGKVEDVVGAVAFLASLAAELITDANLRVDGGWTAR